MTHNLERLKSEQARLDTFRTGSVPWPKSYIKPEDCAKAGFFFVGDGDKVQCTFCHGVVGDWEIGDIPYIEHKKHFPRCPFICKLPVGNISIGRERAAARERTELDLQQHVQMARTGVDVCGPFAPTIRPYAGPDQPPVQLRGAQPLVGDMDEVTNTLAIRTGSGPARKHLVTEQSRLETFVNWPLTDPKQTPQTMSEAGFYYIGISDHVKCFYCDGGLKSWEPNDDPWFEHARWFSQCPFVLLNKGYEFIKTVTEAKPPTTPLDLESLVMKEGGNNSRKSELRVVTDEEIRNLVETPIVQEVLNMGMDIGNVKAALREKLQRTGKCYTTATALLEDVLSRSHHDFHDPEYYSDSDSESDEDNQHDVLGVDVPPSASSVLAARIAQMIKEPSSSLEESEEGGNSNQTNPSHSTTENNLENSSSSGSEDETVAGPSGASINRERVNSNSSESSVSSSQPNASPGPDSGEFTMSSGSDDESRSNTLEKKINQEKASDQKARELEEQVRTLKEARQCKICMDNEADVVFLPCGHLVSCVKCATALSNCALCRQQIKAVVRTYMA